MFVRRSGRGGDSLVQSDNQRIRFLGQTEHVLPSSSATYAFQQFPDARPEVLLTASMGQDGAHFLLLTFTADGLEGSVRGAGNPVALVRVPVVADRRRRQHGVHHNAHPG
ncbi:hypothetical protein [Streptomyces sp. NPDC059761]|uniref:hypothetical protein n=1 Tax=Streptomyces sp. NPDC059761 TaxID=3346937 RepID=UPI00364C0385